MHINNSVFMPNSERQRIGEAVVLIQSSILQLQGAYRTTKAFRGALVSLLIGFLKAQ